MYISVSIKVKKKFLDSIQEESCLNEGLGVFLFSPFPKMFCFSPKFNNEHATKTLKKCPKCHGDRKIAPPLNPVSQPRLQHTVARSAGLMPDFLLQPLGAFSAP